jgi:hypothetical protein
MTEQLPTLDCLPILTLSPQEESAIEPSTEKTVTNDDDLHLSQLLTEYSPPVQPKQEQLCVETPTVQTTSTSGRTFGKPTKEEAKLLKTMSDYKFAQFQTHCILRAFNTFIEKIPSMDKKIRWLAGPYTVGRICKDLGYVKASEYYFAQVSSPSLFRKYEIYYNSIMS